MKALRYFRGNKKMPDVIVIPIKYGSAKKDLSFFEKMVFYMDTSAKNPNLLVVSKDAVKKVGGFNTSLGFGEDKLFRKKIFELVGANKKIK